MKKDLAIILGLFLLIVALLVFGQGFTSTSFIKGNSGNQNVVGSKDQTTVSLKDLSIEAKVVDSASERKKGLSGKDTLPITEGMLFVFEKSDNYGIWMKNMKFPIDIIWISQDKKIVDIALSAAVEPGDKDKDLKIYRPSADSLYVLEINANLASFYNLQIGDEVFFELK